MTPVHLIWIQFFICVALIGLAGVRLIRYGDAIATQTGLSRSWVGLVMVATVTSLPELVTGLSAVTVAQAPDLAVGDALGSCVFNLAILALVDIFHRRHPLYAVASQAHVLSAGFGVILLAATALILALTAQGILPGIGHISWGSLVIVLLYLLAMRTIYLVDRQQPMSSDPVGPAMPLKSAVTGYALASAVIVGSGIWLPMIGVELARQMGWSNSFVGTLFVALATSVPELATTLGAMRIGAIDMAIANLLGSNLFDVLIIAVDDLAYRPGNLFAAIAPVHSVSALSACLMSGVVVVALTSRAEKRILRVGSWAGMALLALYLVNAILQFRHGQ